jgi:hypothetical protein
MLMAGKVVDRRLLLEGKGRRQPEAGRRRCGSLVGDHQATAGIGEQPLDVGKQAAGKHEPVEGLLVAVIASRSRLAPSARADDARTGPAKKIQTCAPLPERERSIAAGTSPAAQASR